MNTEVGENSSHSTEHKKREGFIFEILKPYLEGPIDQVNIEGESPDVRFKYQGRNIGVEITHCYPKSFDKKTDKSKKQLYDALEEFLKSKGIYGIYNITLQENALRKQKINSIKDSFFNEIYGFISGTLGIGDCKYIEKYQKAELEINDATFVHVIEEPVYFIQSSSESDIKSCIEKKNKRFSKYDKSLDEIWLLIYIPTDETHYSINGIASMKDIETGFKRIFIADSLLFRVKQIYQE